MGGCLPLTCNSKSKIWRTGPRYALINQREGLKSSSFNEEGNPEPRDRLPSAFFIRRAYLKTTSLSNAQAHTSHTHPFLLDEHWPHVAIF